MSDFLTIILLTIIESKSSALEVNVASLESSTPSFFASLIRLFNSVSELVIFDSRANFESGYVIGKNAQFNISIKRAIFFKYP